MEIIFVAILISMLTSCSGVSPEETDHRDPPATSCSIDNDVLYCTDGTVYVLPKQSKDGKDADPCKIAGQSISCPDGSTYTFPVPKNGADGVAGAKGETGSSCSVEGAEIKCTDGTSYIIPTPTNGADGRDGQDGKDSIIAIVDPCGPNSSGVDELLFVLSTGDVVAWYQNVGLVSLKNGNYRTTDTSNCIFTVNSGKISDFRGQIWPK